MNTPYIDHLIVIAPSLDEGSDYIGDLLGIRPSFGGTHPGTGTSNALLSLGPRTYLEVIAPPAERLGTHLPLPFGLETGGPPRLSTWSAGVSGLASFAEQASAGGIELGQCTRGERDTPNGTRISWMFSDIYQPRHDGLFPFFMEWFGPHPADTLSAGCMLRQLDIANASDTVLANKVSTLGLQVQVQSDTQAGLIAHIETAAGLVQLS